VQRNVILVKLGASRLEGAGNMGTLQVVTVKDIQPPQLPDDVKRWYRPFQDVDFEIFINVARKLLTRKRMGGLQASGEFVEAINFAKANPKCERLVLGDVDLLLTIRRTAELAMRRTRNLPKVLSSFNQVRKKKWVGSKQ
jgi:hypothetical protein